MLLDEEAKAVCYIYIVECGDGTLYTGWTTDLERRIAEHNAGKGARYTRGRRPVKLVYKEEFEERSLARKREAELKKLSREAKEELIAGSV